jgi:hypothetical protein
VLREATSAAAEAGDKVFNPTSATRSDFRQFSAILAAQAIDFA